MDAENTVQEKVAELERLLGHSQDILEIKDRYVVRTSLFVCFTVSKLSALFSKIRELQSEKANVAEQLVHCQQQCDNYKQSLLDCQERWFQSVEELKQVHIP